MIEPHSAQLGASAWLVNVTWALPMPRLPNVTRAAEPLPLDLAAPLPLPLMGVVSERGVSEESPSLAGGGVAVAVID